MAVTIVLACMYRLENVKRDKRALTVSILDTDESSFFDLTDRQNKHFRVRENKIYLLLSSYPFPAGKVPRKQG